MLNSNLFCIFLAIYCLFLGLKTFDLGETVRIRNTQLLLIMILAMMVAVRPLEISDAYPYYARYHVEPATTTIRDILFERSFYRGTGYSMSKPVNLLFYVCFKIKMPYVFFVFIIASVELFLCCIYARKLLESEGLKSNEYFLLAMFIIFYSFRYQFIAFAQGIAMSMGMPLLYYLREKRYGKALLFLLIAVSIHIGALYFLPFIIVYGLSTRIRQKNYVFVSLWGLSGLLEFTILGNKVGNYLVFIAEIIIKRIIATNEIYGAYARAENGTTAFSIANFLLWILCGVLVFAYCENELYWKLLNNIIIAILINSVLGRWTVVHRFTDISKMFIPVIMIIYLYQAKPLFKVQQGKTLLSLMILFLGVMHGFRLLGI